MKVQSDFDFYFLQIPNEETSNTSVEKFNKSIARDSNLMKDFWVLREENSMQRKRFSSFFGFFLCGHVQRKSFSFCLLQDRTMRSFASGISGFSTAATEWTSNIVSLYFLLRISWLSLCTPESEDFTVLTNSFWEYSQFTANLIWNLMQKVAITWVTTITRSCRGETHLSPCKTHVFAASRRNRGHLLDESMICLLTNHNVALP